jgi:two-component system, chemotaxis family, chemotaxis protein CheY
LTFVLCTFNTTILKRILLVEDTKALAQNMADILQMEGYDIVIREDGQQALSYLKEQTCDLIMTDIVMPNMDGLTLIREIRMLQAMANTPIIVISAKTTEDILKEAHESGSTLFLKKPCDTDHLINSVKALLTV